MVDYHQYLRPEYVATFSSLEIRARMIVEGFIAGLHRSPSHGFSVEFAQHRQYMPGDDLRHLDWKVLGRTDRYHVRQFEEETNLRAWLVLDASSSMGYASEGNVTKFEYAISLAAAVTFLLLRQRDAVGSAIYDTRLHSLIPPSSRSSALHQILGSLSRALPEETEGRATGTVDSLRDLAERIRRPGLTIVLSDFLDEPENVLTALRSLRHRRGDVLAVQILDPRERTFDFGTERTFRDMETGREISTQPQLIRKAYRDAMETFTDTIRRGCREHGIHFTQLDTTTPFDRGLAEILRLSR